MIENLIDFILLWIIDHLDIEIMDFNDWSCDTVEWLYEVTVISTFRH